LVDNPTLVLEKSETNIRQKSIYLSSIYNSEDENLKKETFEKNLADISDSHYFLRGKVDKSDSKKNGNSPYGIDYHSHSNKSDADYHEMVELRETKVVKYF